MNHFFLNHEMYVDGSTYWNIAYGKMPGDVTKHEEGMTTKWKNGTRFGSETKKEVGAIFPYRDFMS